MDLQWAKWIPWLPLLGAVLCMICGTRPAWRKLAGPLSVLSIFIPFLIAVGIFPNVPEGGRVVTAFAWIHVGGFEADFAYFIDSLTMVMLFVVTGVGSLVALYATGYMAGDRGYARFFAAVSLFIFAMTSMIMGDNLLLLFLGWEMVGLASYLLIGYYYDRPTAVAAAKKAFIVNRVGDLGFALGIFLAFQSYGTIHIPTIVAGAQAMLEAGAAATTADVMIPLLLLLGALGKSAQIPFYVWLPDAMEGPSPVSALIHAATMVTSGVYMIARLLPVFELSPPALPAVATIGGVTAIFAATIALCQNDLKKIFAYSTVSQLGYMFLGVGIAMTVGGMFHLISHAFFKGLLFLTAGNVMHAMAGQLDIAKMGGLRHKMPVTCWLMFAACLALAGFPLTAGFFSKDMIIAYTFEKGIVDHWWYLVLGVLSLVTAFITASYGFRAWFRVFWGPEQYEMGDEHHGAEEEDHGHADAHAHEEDHHHEPHEMPWWPMNAPLLLLAIGSLFGGLLQFVGGEGHAYGAIGSMVYDSTARPPATEHEVPTLLGVDLHLAMYFISAVVAIAAILLAWYLHLINRDAAARLSASTAPIVKVLANKYYIDEVYHAVFVKPLRFLGYLFFVIDQLVINGVVYGLAWVPRLLGMGLRPLQHGKLQGYGLGMAAGVAVVALIAWAAVVMGG